ncbi:MAG: FAD-dependent oxidoreductase [Desulfurococcaceae archaeon]
MLTMGDYMRFNFMCRERVRNMGARVAVVGAGPSGLAATGYLSCEGYDVDVYDKLPLPGGLMVFAIPHWRIPPERVLNGARELEERFNVKFILKTKVYSDGEVHEEGDDFVEKRASLEDLLGNYDLVLVSTGTWVSKIPKLPGSSAKGVTTALEYLYKWRVFEYGYTTSRPYVGKNVIVIGAGYSAVDAAERALKAGSEVYLVYRRTIREAPAGIYEIERLKKEGVNFIELVAPVEIVADSDVVKAVKLQKMTLGPPDETGRPKPIPVPGSEFVVEADLVIFATGESPTPPLSSSMAEKLGLKLNKDGTIAVNELMQTSVQKLFAAGDVATGPSRIGPAVRSGLKAARSMHYWFSVKTGRLVSPMQVAAK